MTAENISPGNKKWKCSDLLGTSDMAAQRMPTAQSQKQVEHRLCWATLEKLRAPAGDP
jgi:hypothetical protein